MIPPAVSRRLVLALAVLAAVAVGLPALLHVARGGGDVRLGAAAPARLAARWPGLAVQDVAVERGPGLPQGTVRVGVTEPTGVPRADVLFLHGHSDRMDNHEALFTAWRDTGVRVVSFDLPEHGGTDAGSLDTWSLDQIVRLAARIEQRTRADRSRPLFLAGFSLGGELAFHAAAHPGLLSAFGRRPAGLVLLSPALAVLPFTGGDGVSRPRDLVHPGGADLAPPAPAVPLANPLFAAGLLVQGRQDLALAPPHDIPVFVAVGGSADDRYVDVAAIRTWAVGLAALDVRVDAIGCAGARHAVDNEAWPVGGDVSGAAAAFVGGVLTGRPQSVTLRRCRPFGQAFLDAGPA